MTQAKTWFVRPAGCLVGSTPLAGKHLWLLILSMLVPWASTANAGKYNKNFNIGDAAPVWSQLPGADGKKYASTDFKNKKVLILVLTCNSCPYAVDYEKRMKEFWAKYCGKGKKVALVAINVNLVPSDSLDEMAKRSKKEKFNFPYVFDKTQAVGRKLGALRTPEFFVFNQQRKLVYMGAMDDSTDARRVTKPYLVQAVEATLAGKPVDVKETPPIGCLVRYKRTRRRR